MKKRINELKTGERFTYNNETYTVERELTVRGQASQYMCRPDGKNAVARPFIGNLEVEALGLFDGINEREREILERGL